MSRQQVEFKVVGADKDSGEEDVTAIKPVSDGEPGQSAVFKRPSENLRTRTEVIRDELENLKFLSDADRTLLLTSPGSVTWAGLPAGTFSATADLTLKPFTAPDVSTAARLIIGAGTTSQITIRTRQNGVAGQPRAYNGANSISFDFTPVDTGTGVVVITVDGTPANNFHVQYDSNAISGTTVQQMMDYLNNVTPTVGGAAFVAAGLEALVEGTLGPNGGPLEVGFPTPPGPLVGAKVVCSGPEQALRFMSGAADAEKHNITPAQLTTFFADPLNTLVEGDVVCLSYDDLVMITDGGRRQSIDEFPENKADVAGLNLFLMRRFPARLPGALPVAAVVNGILIFSNNRSYLSGETGPLVSSGAAYQGSPAAPNSWADGTVVAGPISFETALDTVIQTLGTKSGVTPGAIKIGFTPSGNIAANTVKGAIEELDSEKAGLALANTFTTTNTFTPAGAGVQAIIATGGPTGGTGGQFTGGTGDSYGVIGQGVGLGAGAQGTGGANGNGVIGQGGSLSGTGVDGTGSASGGVGVWGHGEGTDYGVRGTGGSGGGTGVHGLGLAGGTGVTGLGNAAGSGVAGTGGANGAGIYGESKGTGSNELFASGTGAGLLLSAGAAASLPMIIVPKSPALTTATIGAMGMESFTTGAVPRARLRSGIGNSERSGVRIAIPANATWTSSALYYWIDCEGICHVRGAVYAGANQTFNENSTVILFTAAMPAGARPTGEEQGSCIVLCDTRILPGLFSVQTDGDLAVIQFSGGAAPTNVNSVQAIMVDYPLF